MTNFPFSKRMVKVDYFILFISFQISNVHAELVNVALYKNTSQSGEVWPSRNAVDGQTDCQAVSNTSFTLTNYSILPWWQVDLGDKFSIQEIIVYGRHDSTITQLQGFRLYLSSNNTFSEQNIVYINKDYNDGRIVIRQNLSGQFQFVKLDLPDTYRNMKLYSTTEKNTGPIVLCEVEVLVNMTNIAFRKPVTMSTVYKEMVANKSVDGSTDQLPDTCNCCSHSSDEANPWLTVDLLRPYKIYHIRVAGRLDDFRENRQLQGLQIYANSSHNLNTRNDSNENTSFVTVTIPGGVISQFITLKRPHESETGEWYLVVCEVEIYTTECPASKYGYDCSDTCNTCNQMMCNNTNGLCYRGCVPGYQPNDPFCQTKCQQGKYGFNCNETCHHCKTGSICNFQSGNCPDGCSPGFNGSRCHQACPNGYFGDCTHVCHCKDDISCSKQDGSCHNGCAFGWSGTNCSLDLNLIQRLIHTRTHQSSTYLNYSSLKAVDGKDSYDVDHCDCCSVTDGDPPSWWQIDLGQKYLIDALKIYGRSDTGDNNNQFEQATIYAGNKTLINNTSSMEFIYQIPQIANTTQFSFYLDRAIIAQFFIVKHSERILTICEFKLYEKVCSIGTFGSGCFHECHCSDNKTCDPVTGLCRTPGCLPGWRGQSCDLVCSLGTFGNGCSNQCHCLDHDKCDSVTGICKTLGCLPGWTGETCVQVCEARTFGQNCEKTCHCINQTKCDNIHGICEKHECEPGWSGASCNIDSNVLHRLKNLTTSMSSVVNGWTSDRAVDGYIGPDPEDCQCCSGTQNSQLSWWSVDFGEIFPINGITVYSSNEKGYQSLDGFRVILSNNFAYNSTEFKVTIPTASSRIYEITLSNILTRYVKIQRPGVLTLCEVKVSQGDCLVGTFGNDCTKECHCADNRPCNVSTGYCQSDACKTGWLGKSCNTQCPQDTFGDNCSETCYCAEGACTNNYGICPGKCRRGYRGPHCNKECPPDTFGEDCSEACYCAEGTCTDDYGICPGKCRRGYHGSHCNEVVSALQNQADSPSASNKSAIIGGTVGASAAALILVIIGVLVFKFRKNNSESNKNEYNTPNMHITPRRSTDYDTIDNSKDSQRASSNIYENEAYLQ